MQRTIRVGRAEVAKSPLEAAGEEESCLSADHMPAAAALNTTNSESADKRLVGFMAEGVVVSGYGV